MFSRCCWSPVTDADLFTIVSLGLEGSVHRAPKASEGAEAPEELHAGDLEIPTQVRDDILVMLQVPNRPTRVPPKAATFRRHLTVPWKLFTGPAQLVLQEVLEPLLRLNGLEVTDRVEGHHEELPDILETIPTAVRETRDPGEHERNELLCAPLSGLVSDADPEDHTAQLCKPGRSRPVRCWPF